MSVISLKYFGGDSMPNIKPISDLRNYSEVLRDERHQYLHHPSCGRCSDERCLADAYASPSGAASRSIHGKAGVSVR